MQAPQFRLGCCQARGHVLQIYVHRVVVSVVCCIASSPRMPWKSKPPNSLCYARLRIDMHVVFAWRLLPHFVGNGSIFDIGGDARVYYVRLHYSNFNDIN